MSYVASGILIHSLIIGVLLGMILLALQRRGLCHWLSYGFWSWASFSLYFFITPLIQYYGDPFYLVTRLAVTEGLLRMVWVTFCVAVGIAVFFFAYFRTAPSSSSLGLSQDWPPGTWLVISLALAGAAYSLIYFRGAFGLEQVPTEIKGGKYVGQVMGYQAVMHHFANFPIILLLLRRSTRWLGVILTGIILLARFEDAWDRYSAVSLLLATTMLVTLIKQQRWPHALLMVSAVVFTVLMHARGHVPLSEFIASGKIVETSRQEVKRGEGANMLATLYLQTYLHDRTGYNYGIPFVSKLVFGVLPRKYFPNKDWLEEEFSGRLKFDDIPGYQMMYGAKSTVIGDLYGFGNIIAIILGMFLLGLCGRKLDGFLGPGRPQPLQAMGICWLSCVWMMLGSSLSWVAITVYLNAIPFVILVLFARLARQPEEPPIPPKPVAALKSPKTTRIRHATRRDV
jgi:hypothetical protein